MSEPLALLRLNPVEVRVETEPTHRSELVDLLATSLSGVSLPTKELDVLLALAIERFGTN
jgi:hypothetical protein